MGKFVKLGLNVKRTIYNVWPQNKVTYLVECVLYFNINLNNKGFKFRLF